MSLLGFHRFLIVTGIVFCLGFAVWELRLYLGVQGGAGALALTIVFALLAAGLTVYLARLRSILGLRDR